MTSLKRIDPLVLHLPKGGPSLSPLHRFEVDFRFNSRNAILNIDPVIMELNYKPL